MVQRTIGILLIIAVLAIAAHDAWRFTTAHNALRDATHDLALWAAENTEGIESAVAANAVAKQARAKAVELMRFERAGQRVRVWTRSQVTDTLVAGTIANLVAGMSLSEARRAPLTIRDYREAGFQ